MADTTFVPGTVITTSWLNEINDAIHNQTSDLSGAVARPLAEKLGDLVSSKDFGGVSDGTTNDTTAIASMVATEKPFVFPAETAYQYGTLGPAIGIINRVDYATIGTDEKITNSTFTGSATGWALSNFTYSANAISHSAGTVGSATQSITLKPWRHYLLTVILTTTTRGGVDFQFNGTTMLDDLGYNIHDPSTNTHYYPFLNGTTTTATFGILTDTSWAGSISTMSVIEVAEEFPLNIIGVPQDDTLIRIPNGIKFGRWNAGVLAMGDRSTMAFATPPAVWNVAIGPRSLQVNMTGFENTAVGAFAGRCTTTSRNSFYGYSAGKYNTVGEHLTFIGYKAGGSNSTGSRNDAYGMHTLLQNTSGTDNLAAGYQSQYNTLNTSGNTSVGSQSAMNARGIQNTYLGALSGFLNASTNVTYTYSYGVTLGSEAKIYGENGTVVGFSARVGVEGSPVNNSIAIGSGAVTLVANSTKIGVGITKAAISGRIYSLEASTSDATASGITYTAAQFASQAFTRSGPSGNFSDTTPTAAAIVAAIPGAEVGLGYEIWIRNTSGFTLTMLAGAGVSLGGTTTIATVQSRLYKVIPTNVGPGTETVTVVGICSAAN